MTDILDEESFLTAVARLAGSDPHVHAALEVHGLPGFWHRPPGFATLALFIIEQQVSLASARAVFERLVAITGGVNAAALLATPPDRLQSAGLTRQKLRYLLLLAEEVASGTLDLDRLAVLSDAEVRRRLIALTGIGPWTADVYLLSALRRPDVWPIGDRALAVGTAELLDLDEVPTADTLDLIGDRWRPHRSTAARIAWHVYLTRRGRAETEVAGLGGH